jgi:uncharacterized protein (TIGR02679 family)
MHPDLKRDLLTLLRNPHLERLLEALHASLERNEEPRGRQEVTTREEADALEDLIGKRVTPGRKVSVREIDQRLRENTIFHCSLEEAIELFRGRPLERARRKKAEFLKAQDLAIQRCFQMLPRLGLSPRAYAIVVSWMHAEQKHLRGGFRRWKDQGLLSAIEAVAKAFDHLPDRDAPLVYLAELANETTGDAHGLDAGRPAGILFLRALAHHYPETAARERRGSAAWRTNLLSEARVARDPVSVRVDTFGLMGNTPYLKELRRAALTRSVNLDDLAILSADVRAYHDTVFIAENPTVFTVLFKHVRGHYVVDSHPTLVCTNGTMNLAEWGLLDALCQSGAHLFYCGDFDVRGLEIASAILERYPGSASPWRMGPDDYRAAIRGKEGEIDPHTLERSKRWFPELTREMAAHRKAADQESLIPRLRADLNRFITEAITPPRLGHPPDSGRGSATHVPH